ncbi:hypothetical protein Tco_1379084, partial [Tanacetum coccineum]
MGVRVNFTSQSTTAALSIENGSLFEGESEFEKLKIYLITLVSIRSDWEDLPWLFRSVENLISVDISELIQLLRAFTCSEVSLAIYMQQFWNTMKYDEKTGVYSCQVDEQWFDLSADLLRKALAITPVDPAHPFELPPSGNTVIDFVNQLGYPEPVEIVSNIRVNYVYQPWRAILTLINQCLTGKDSFGRDQTQTPCSANAVGNLLKDPKKKVTPLLIPYGRFSKVIIYYLASNNNIHRRPDSAVHHTGDDFLLGNLKFVPKGETVEVFGMAIPDPLITEAIQQSSYYPKYLEMVAKNTKKTPQESASKQPATKRAPPKKPTTTTPVKPSKPAPAPTKKPSKQLQGEGDDPDLELAKKISLDEHQEKREGGDTDADLEKAIKLSLDPSFFPQGQPPVGGLVIRDQVSETIPKLAEVVGKGKAKSETKLDPGTLEKAYEALAWTGLMPLMWKSLILLGIYVFKTTNEDDQEKTNVADETKTDTSTPQVTAPIVEISSLKPSQVTTPPINTEATTITTTLPEITPFIALQLRVVKLELDMAEVKKTDHSAAVLASIESQVPTVVDNYLGDKVDNALLKALERHSEDLIRKYSGLPGPESSKKPESSKRPVSEKSPAEIIRVKKEQEEQRPKSSYTIKATDTAALKEFDLKTALFKTMNENKSANRNTANYHLYHALMEALIEDENAMDREVADKVKDHKRKHDSDDDDDEGPSAGSNQGKSAKRKRPDSGASGSAQPPPKDDDQSSKKPREFGASATKQHPALSLTGWQITDTRDAGADSSMHRSDPKSKHSEQSSGDLSKQDKGNVSDMEDTDYAYIPKVSTTTWFKPIPESERPATPEPEWTIPPNDFPEPEQNWANAYATTFKVPEENKLQRKTYDMGSFIKWFCRRTGKKKLCKADLEGPAFNLVKAFHKN